MRSAMERGAEGGLKSSIPVPVKIFTAFIVILIHGFTGISFFFGQHSGYPERWYLQFSGLLIASACIVIIIYCFPHKWILAAGFTLRSIIAILIVTAMPQKIAVFSWLTCVIIYEIFLFTPRSLGIITGCLLTFIMSLQRYLTHYTWNYFQPGPGTVEMVTLWIQCAAVLCAGFILGTMNEYVKKSSLKLEGYRQSNVFLVETNLRLQEYTLRTKHESIINERNRISREIHDSVGYILTNLIMILDLTRELLYRDQQMALEKLNNGIEQAKMALSEVRRAVRALRPRVEVNYLQAISDILDAFTQATGVEISFQTEIPERLGEDYERLVYRVIQESLTNSFRHGQANRVRINLRLKNQRINLVISDNGMGADTINLGCGLTGIRERVEALEGTLMVDSSPHRGFIIRINIPWSAESTVQNEEKRTDLMNK
jgi:signal transduction histidine kinase